MSLHSKATGDGNTNLLRRLSLKWVSSAVGSTGGAQAIRP